MNKIKQLIQQYCPDGVEFKELGEIGVLLRGNGLQKTDFIESGVGCIHYGQIYTYFGTFVHKTKSFVSSELAKKLKKVQKNDLIITTTSENLEDVCKTITWLGEEEIVTGGHATILKHNQDSKYLAYYFQTKYFFDQKKKYARGAKVIEIKTNDIAKITFPIPPLPIQKEIVTILDTFTALDGSLQAELEARRKQYEHYRNQLLNFEGKEVEWKTLGEISTNKNYKRIPITQSKRKSGKYRYFGASGVVDYVDNYIFDGDYLLISEDGANLVARKTPIAFSVSGKFWVNNHAHVIEFENYNTRRLVEIYLNSIDLSIFITGAAQPKLNQDNLYKILFPVPPLSEQQRIVSILDKFDALVNNELPAEIAARRKQYEYYREKLLTFESLTN